MNSSPAFSSSSFFEALSSPSLWKTVGVGALAGLGGFILGEGVNGALMRSHDSDITRVLAVSSAWVGVISLVMGAALLAFDNASSLRGQWHRDLGPGVALFGFLGIASGAAAQVLYSVGLAILFAGAASSGAGFEMSGSTLVLSSLVRGLGWALFGAGVGASIGILRGDKGQTQRGALGGALGGFLGGTLFNFIGVVLGSNLPGASDAPPRAIGVILLGAFLGGALRLVQETLKSAWLLGISTGPYEGKEYPLGKARLTVGRGGHCDLSLFRDESLAPQVGALVFQNGSWWWQGEPISINGQIASNAPLLPGARLQIGSTLFRFNDRSKSAPRAPFPAPVAPAPQPGSTQAVPSPQVQPVATQVAPVAPVPVAWTFSPAVGNALTGFRFEAGRTSATIGRSDGNDWQLKDDGTSSQHAKLERTFDGLALTDLGSTNGTFVNGQKIAPHVPVELRGKETVRIGRTQWMLARAS